MLFSERPPIYASPCMTISGGRTEQLDINCRFSAASLALFLSFTVVEYIWFFHGALQLFQSYLNGYPSLLQDTDDD